MTDTEQLRSDLAAALARDLRQLGLTGAPEFVVMQQAEIERLRLCLQGIASCGTCGACRGAAESVLHPTGNDAGHNRNI